MPSLPNLLSLGACTLALGVNLSRPSLDESAEPAQRFVLELDKHEFEIEAGKEFKIEVEGMTLEGRLRPLPERTLRLEELAFDFPAALTYSYEAGEGTEIWTLNGHQATLMLYRFEAGGTAEDLLDLFVASVTDAYPDAGVEQHSTTLQLGGKRHDGTSLFWNFGGFVHVQEAYVLDPTEPVRRALVLQDTRDPGAEPGKEWLTIRAALERTYEWTGQ